jgi:hypothetical protein
VFDDYSSVISAFPGTIPELFWSVACYGAVRPQHATARRFRLFGGNFTNRLIVFQTTKKF